MDTYYTEKLEKYKILYGNCKPYNRCKKFKTCTTCNRIRQAHLSDLTEMAGRFSKHSQYAVVMPFGDGQENIKEIKTKITRKIRKSTNGAMISVESSKNQALHLNIILNSDELIKPLIFEKILENTGGGSVFVDELHNPLDIRKATSYSSKISSIPDAKQYAGNILNTAGNIRTMKQILHSDRMMSNNPYMALASMSQAFAKIGVLPPNPATTPKKTIIQLTQLIEQLNIHGKCYSTKYGVLDWNGFNKIYQEYISN